MGDLSRNFVHIGPGKTATTFLQRAIFSRHSEINYLGKVWREDAMLLKALAKIVRFDSLAFCLSDVRAEFSRAIEAGRPKRVHLVSEEDLSAWRFIDAGLCALRMKQIFGEATILVTLRHPTDWIESCYFWLLQLGLYDSSLDINDWVIHWLRKPRMGNPLSDLRVAKIIEIYADVFGKENIQLLVYEELLSDSVGFARNLANMLAISESEMQNLFSSKEAATRDKMRLSQGAVDLLIEANRLLIGPLDEFIGMIRTRMLPHAPPVLGSQLASKVSELETGTEVGVETRRALFAETFKAIRGRLPCSPAAKAELKPNVMMAIQKRYGNQYRWIQETFGVDLSRYQYPMS